jgi:hypothetical protein
MSPRKIVGVVLVVVGILGLAWGGVFWRNEKTLFDDDLIEVTTSEREGFRLPPLAGGLALLGGIVLLILPDRRRV